MKADITPPTVAKDANITSTAANTVTKASITSPNAASGTKAAITLPTAASTVAKANITPPTAACAESRVIRSTMDHYPISTTNLLTKNLLLTLSKTAMMTGHLTSVTYVIFITLIII